MPSANISPEVTAFLAQNPVCAVGISGGKDSHACLLAVHKHLEAIGFTGPRIAVHADLGRVEWEQSLPKCQELADSLGWELMVVRRNAGDLMDRWLSRWDSNVGRYEDLSCAQIIMPWSTPAMRFCIELKAQIIRSNLKKRFPGQSIVNVTGVRRQESSSRAKMPLWKHDPQLSTKVSEGYTWNAIIEWTTDEVFEECGKHSVPLHEAYVRYNMTRVSCSFCIMASHADLVASATCETNQAAYREMVGLEIASGFSFQSNRWLGDVAPHLLADADIARLDAAKRMAKVRSALESQIPPSLRFESQYPVAMPTLADAQLLAEIRIGVSEAQGFRKTYTTGHEVLERYEELIVKRDSRKPTEQLIEAFQIPVYPTHQLGLAF